MWARSGEIQVTGQIRDRRGTVVATIVDSKLYASPRLGYDLNWDLSAYEVVNPQKRPVLQIQRDDIRKELLMNVFMYRRVGPYSDEMEFFVCDSGGCAGFWSVEKRGLERQGRARRIFRYPGYEHPGEREGLHTR